MEKQIGKRIRQLRGELSRLEFAENYGISASSLVRWEKGENFPDLAFLSNLKNATGVSFDWLLDGIEDGSLQANDLPSKEIQPLPVGGKKYLAHKSVETSARLFKDEVELLNQEIARLFADKRELSKDLREALLEIDDKAALIDQLSDTIRELTNKLEGKPNKENEKC